MQGTYEERMEYYAAQFTIWSLDQARQALKRLHTGADNISPSQDYIVWAGFYSIYAKPFMRNQKPKVSNIELLIPADLQELHYKALKFRNKLFAHNDKSFNLDNGTLINSAIFNMDENGVSSDFLWIYP